MKQIIANTPGVAWKKALIAVLDGGHSIKDGEKNLKELLNVFLTVEYSLSTDEILEKYADQAMIT